MAQYQKATEYRARLIPTDTPTWASPWRARASWTIRFRISKRRCSSVPGIAKVHSNLGAALAESGKGDAIAECQKALQLESRMARHTRIWRLRWPKPDGWTRRLQVSKRRWSSIRNRRDPREPGQRAARKRPAGRRDSAPGESAGRESELGPTALLSGTDAGIGREIRRIDPAFGEGRGGNRRPIDGRYARRRLCAGGPVERRIGDRAQVATSSATTEPAGTGASAQTKRRQLRSRADPGQGEARVNKRPQ